MKRIIAIAMAVAAVTACNKNETAPGVEGQKQQLNILTSVSTSRAVVAGTTLPQGSAIGVHVTQGSAPVTAYVGENYPDAAGENLQSGQNVRFDNTSNANEWVSEESGGSVKRLMIGAEEGTVYGYYPYADAVTGVGADATIPVNALLSGNIDLSSAIAASKNYAAAEVDYLYYKPDASGRKTVKSTSTTTAPLSMAHAMASVSFRMYVSSEAPIVNNGDANYYLMGYTIKNKTSKTLFVATDDNSSTMKIADGAITTGSGGEISRTLNAPSGYALHRVDLAEASDSEKGDLVWFGNLTFPIAAIAHSTVNSVEISNDIEIVFSIKKGSSGTPENYVVPLVVDLSNGDSNLHSDKWLAGNNYQYTIRLNAFLALGIEQVSVAPWVDVLGGDITIE